MLILRACFSTYILAFISTVAPVIIPTSLFTCATPGISISVANKCIIPGALIIHSAAKLEWEDALHPVSRVALRGCCRRGLHHLGWQVEVEHGDADELGIEERLHH